MSHKENKKIHVQDNSKQNDPVEQVLNDPVAQMKALLAKIPEEQRKAMAIEAGLIKARAETPRINKGKEAWEKAVGALFNKTGDVKEMLTACEFPQAFSVTFEVDKAGFFSSTLKRVREEYGPRQKKDEPAEQTATPAA
jgi:hypothetical protein